MKEDLEAEPLLAAPEVNVGMPALSIGHPFAAEGTAGSRLGKGPSAVDCFSWHRYANW